MIESLLHKGGVLVMNTQTNASLLRYFVEEIPMDGLGVRDKWTWEPNAKIDGNLLSCCSPTTEYTVESSED